MTGNPPRAETFGRVWWLVLSFFVPCILGGTYGSIDAAVKQTRDKQLLYKPAGTLPQTVNSDEIEDRKERDQFLHDGMITGVGGLILGIMTCVVSDKLNKKSRASEK